MVGVVVAGTVVSVVATAVLRSAISWVIRRSFIVSASVLLRYTWVEGGSHATTYPPPYRVKSRAGSPLSKFMSVVVPFRAANCTRVETSVVLEKTDGIPAKISFERVALGLVTFSVRLPGAVPAVCAGRISVNRGRSFSVTTRILPSFTAAASFVAVSWLYPASPPMKRTSVDTLVKHEIPVSSSTPALPGRVHATANVSW